MRSSRLIVASLAAMAAGISAGAVAITAGAAAPSLGLGGASPAPSSNGGRRGAGMAAKRAAMKARNVKRHRNACKRAA